MLVDGCDVVRQVAGAVIAAVTLIGWIGSRPFWRAVSSEHHDLAAASGLELTVPGVEVGPRVTGVRRIGAAVTGFDLVPRDLAAEGSIHAEIHPATIGWPGISA